MLHPPDNKDAGGGTQGGGGGGSKGGLRRMRSHKPFMEVGGEPGRGMAAGSGVQRWRQGASHLPGA